MLKLLMLLALMLGADFNNTNNVMKPEIVQQVQEIYAEKYEEIQEINQNSDITYGNIWVGDKRILDIDRDCNITDKENNFVVADKDADFDWLEDTGVKEINKIVSSNPDVDSWTIVLNCGLYDSYNAIRYTELYGRLASKYNICCVSLMPVTDDVAKYINDEDKEVSITNSDVKFFNSSISSFVQTETQLKDLYKHKDVWLLSLYSMLENTGYETGGDGISYDKDTNKYVYYFISMCLDIYYLPTDS